VGPRCSFCGTFTGPFSEVEGLFTVLMCASCQAARSSRSPPLELLAGHHPGEPRAQWSCPLEGCDFEEFLPWALEGHTAAEHPGWVARYELVRALPNQLERVVFRRVEGSSSK
jgi:hypothetical protein